MIKNGAVLRYLQRTSVYFIYIKLFQFDVKLFFQTILIYCGACILKLLYRFKREK